MKKHQKDNLRKTAFMATAHCLTGCAIGEVLGLVIGTALGWSDFQTIVLAVILAFIFGYALTILPLLRANINLRNALPLAFASDTFSITVMEIVDNGVMLLIPGAMHAPLTSLLFWGSLTFALAVAFVFAYPVNLYLLSKGKGHALVHASHGQHAKADTKHKDKKEVNTMKQSIIFGIVGLLVGGLLTYAITANNVNKTQLASQQHTDTAMQHDSGSMSMSAMMASLEGKKGDEFDKAFLSSMIEHHEGAIDMAKAAQQQSDRQEIIDLANDILTAQMSEIEMMTKWQKEWGFTK